MRSSSSDDVLEQYRLIVDNITEYAVLFIDVDGRVRYWNPGAVNILGWNAEEVADRPASFIFTPEDRAAGAPRREMDVALDLGHAVDERWHLRRDGSRFFAKGRLMVARDPAGRHVGFVKVLRDLTDELAAEQERERQLQTSRQAVRALKRWFDGAPGFVALLRGPDHVVELANAACERLLGRRGLIGQRVFDAVPAARGQGFEALLDEVMRTGRSVSGRAMPMRLPGGQGAGPRELYVDFTYEPVRDAGGSVSGVFVQGHDVTDHVRSLREQRDIQATLSAVLDSLPLGAVIVDPRGRIVRDNAAHRALWGIPPETACWEEYGQWEGYWPASGARIQAHEWAMARTLLHGEVVRSELVECQPFGGGPRRFFLNNAAPVRNAEGDLIGGVVVELDVTEQRTSDARLRDSEARMKAIFETTPVGLFFAEAPGGRIVVANRQAEEMLGHPVLPSANVPDYAEYAACFPDGRRLEGHEYPLARALAGEAQPRAELLYRRGDGRVVWLRSIAAPLRGTDGSVTGALVALLDIDGERRAFEALQTRSAELGAAQLRLDIAMSAASMGIWDWSATTGEAYWSPQMFRLMGVEPTPGGRASGEMFMSRLHPEDRGHVEASIARALAAVETYEMEARIVRPDGEVRWVFGRGEALPDERGNGLRMVGVNIDVTERKRAELALLEVDRRRNEFLAMLGHELRNPLAPITNAVRLLESDRVPPEGRVAAVGIVKRQSAHLARLVDDLLEVSRVTRGLIELRKEEVPLVDAVLSAVESVRPLLREQKQKLDIDVPAGLRLVADANRLVQIVANLLNNAIKYTPEGGHVSVAASGEPGWIRLVVGDTGIGIEPEMLQQVFELFRQGDASLDRSRGGLGIGLHLVERLVALHGGTISIDSPGRNLGTTVTVRLPRGEPRAALQAGDEGVPRGDGPPASTILVVDDNVDAAQSLAMLLQGDGHRVSVAYDGIEGLALARRVKPHAALLDLGLPGMNGFELARQMRMDPELADVAIVAVSGYGQASDRERSAQAGFDAHLLKPVGLDDLYRALAGALAARGARRG